MASPGVRPSGGRLHNTPSEMTHPELAWPRHRLREPDARAGRRHQGAGDMAADVSTLQ